VRIVERMRPNTSQICFQSVVKITKVLILLIDCKTRYILNEKFTFMTLSFMTRLGEKNGFSHHNILCLRGITESVNFFPTNAGLVKPLQKEPPPPPPKKNRFVSVSMKRSPC
jgi:hypothetical protein